MVGFRRARGWLAAACVAVGGVLAAAPAAQARAHTATAVAWATCGDVPGVQCGAVPVPLDYDRPGGRPISIALARVPAKDPARRLGSLFFNFGGPGGTAVDYLQATAGAGLFDALNQRYDIVAFDPRGVGQSTPSIDCKVDQKTLGVTSQPFTTPLNLDVDALVAKDRRYIGQCLARNGEILRHVSTGNVARDLDVLRQAVGDRKLSYLGFSYGTFLGETYMSLFPGHFRRMVLDGPVGAENELFDPVKGSNEQTAAFERAFSRFLRACAADQVACSGFGGNDPEDVFDALADQADAAPIPAPGYAPDPVPVTGDDLRALAIVAMYSKQNWGVLAKALKGALDGDASLAREIVDEDVYARLPDGSYDPGADRFFTISGSEQRWPRRIGVYLREGAQAFGMFDHFWFNHGYSELNWGLYPVRDRDAYYGPFGVSSSDPTPLVVATTYDPATPYRGALAYVRELGNARLLTMRGDGHTAYGGQSACVDAAVNAYLLDGTLPPAGTSCRQDAQFTAPPPTAAAAAASSRRGVSPVHAQLPLARPVRLGR